MELWSIAPVVTFSAGHVCRSKSADWTIDRGNSGWSAACLHQAKGSTADSRDFELWLCLIFGQGSCFCWTPVNTFTLWANTRAFIASSYSLCVNLWSTAELLKWCPCFATSYYGMLGKFNLRQITKKMQKKRKLQTRWQCMCSILEHLTLIHIYIHQHETLEHYLKMCLSLSADLSLDHFAMRRFYNDTLSALMTPSQKR